MEHILSLSYGKDSIACIEAVKQLGYPLDRIVHAEVWATDTISADLPPMVEFKEYADKKIKERYGIDVEHYCAMRNGEKLTYEKLFYHIPNRKKDISAFQRIGGGGCGANSQLKKAAIHRGIVGVANGIPNAKRELVYKQTQIGFEDSKHKSTESFLTPPKFEAENKISYSI